VPVDADVYEQGASVLVAANPSGLVRVNWTFLGWSTSSTATLPTYAVDGSTVTPPNHPMGNSNVVFFAVWLENPKYTVTYNGNTNTSGVAPNDPNAPYYTGFVVTVLDQGLLVKTNWTFKGWALSSSATTVEYTAGQTFTISQNTVLFAVWQENPKYTITYDGNGATSGTIPVDPDSPHYTGLTVTVLGQGSLLKANHNFLGWSTTQNATDAQFTQGQTFTIKENTKLFAVWTEYPKYTVEYDENGESGGSTPLDSNLYYQGFAVTIQANIGGLTKTGYVFKGWATSSSSAVAPDYVVSGSTVTPSTFTMGSANVVLYAVWEEDTKYSVTYLGNGADSGDAPVDAGSPYESGVTVTVLGQNTLQKTGYIFLGVVHKLLSCFTSVYGGAKICYFAEPAILCCLAPRR
jgi:uncharacterized repeat protein (TIGR02543 family)